MQALLTEKYPGTEVHGENFPAAPWKKTLARIVQACVWAFIAVMLAGDRIFPALQIPPPQLYLDLQQNKLPYIFGAYFIGNTIVQNLSNTGAFEISYQGQMVWSKLLEGRMPSVEEIFQGLKDAGLQ